MSVVRSLQFKKTIEKLCILYGQGAQAYRKAFGTHEELKIGEQFADLDNLFCYHQFRPYLGSGSFEIDLLVVTAQAVFVIEVKAYVGMFSLDTHDERWLIRMNKKPMERLKNPVPQCVRAANLTQVLLEKYAIDLPVIPIVIIGRDFYMSPLLTEYFNSSPVTFLNLINIKPFFLRYCKHEISKDSAAFKLIELLYFRFNVRPILFEYKIQP